MLFLVKLSQDTATILPIWRRNFILKDQFMNTEHRSYTYRTYFTMNSGATILKYQEENFLKTCHLPIYFNGGKIKTTTWH